MFSRHLDVFTDKLTVDDRVPCITFNLPSIGGEYGVLCPKGLYWVQLAILVALQSLLSAVFAIVIYKLVVRTRRNDESVTPYFVVFGAVIPAAAIVPYQLLKMFDIRSRLIAMGLIVLPINVIFRSLEALFGFSPPAVEDSLSNYCLYYASLMECQFDSSTKRPIKQSLEGIIYALRRYIVLYLTLAALFSLLEPMKYVPYQIGMVGDEEGHRQELINLIPKHLVNNFVAATLTSMAVSHSTLGMSLGVTLLTGFRMIDVVRNPMFASTSPSDFWGRRWNRLVHSVLKRGIYKPFRTIFPPSIAAAATFFASGLLHEYVVSIHFYMPDRDCGQGSDTCASCHHPRHGRNLCFFAWNGIVIVLEYMIGDWPFFRWLQKTFPPPVVTGLVILTALPVGHWFTDDWIEGGLFTQMQLGFPRVVYLK